MLRAGIVVSYLCFGLLTGRAICQQSPMPPSKHSPAPQVALDAGSILNGTYRNNYFQFSYQLPFGWVDRTSDMRADVETGKSRVLLAIFERPPAASGNTINSAVIIAAESLSSYPGLKNAADYFGPLAELTESKGFKSVNDPYEFPVDGKRIVRQDFTKPVGNLAMHQSSLVMISKHYILSFTFIAGSDDDVTELVEGLKFGR